MAVLPALAAAPSEAKLEVNENCVEADWPCWATPGSGANPTPASKVTIATGGEVKFADNATTAATVVWTGSAPACSGVPTSRHDQMGRCSASSNNQGPTSSKARPSSTREVAELHQIRNRGRRRRHRHDPHIDDPHIDDHNTDDHNDAERAQPQLWLAFGRRLQGAQARRQPARIDTTRVDPGVPGRRRRTAGSRPVRRRRLAGQGWAP